MNPSPQATNLTVDDVIQAWVSEFAQKQRADPDGFERGRDLFRHLLDLLANGRPVTAQQLAAKTNRPAAEIQAGFQAFKEHGYEFDDQGNLVGAALTLKPTRHHFHIRGHNLYAWCALDTLFLPGLIGDTAQVRSTCPVSGAEIHLTVTPDGVRGYRPETAVLSITLPGISCRTGESDGPPTGPNSDTCSQMHFFRSPAAARPWLQTRPGIAMLSVEEAWQLAAANWLKQPPPAEVSTAATCCCA